MKVCLAGTSCLKNNKEEYNKIPFLLESFYTIKEWQIYYINKSKLFLLDSGAFTFMNNFKGKVNWDEYIEKYADFINKYDIKYFFELDIDVVVGIKEVERLRKKLEKLTNKKCIPVWLKSRGLEYWEKMTKEYDYVAIGGIVIKEIKQKDYKYFIPLLEIAKKNKCKVHGLGFTSMKWLKKIKFYSVDSTSWTSGCRFGIIYKFINNKLIQIKKPFNTRITKIKENEVIKNNLKEWIKFQEYADKYL